MRQTQRSSEATLAPSFAPLHLKKFELEFAVDPLFKKASADFDEGGARGLLLNNLSVDINGRLAFDSSDNDDQGDVDIHSESLKSTKEAEDPSGLAAIPDSDKTLLQPAILSLGTKYFRDLQELEGQVLCPSMQDFDLGDPSTLPGSLPQLGGACEATVDGSASVDDEPVTFQENGDLDSGEIPAAGLAEAGFMVGDERDEVTFGEGGEQWALHAASGLGIRAAAQDDAHLVDVEESHSNHADARPGHDQFGVALDFSKRASTYDAMLGYFDNIAERNWAGPEHWRIRKLRQSTSWKPPLQPRKKERDAYEIDFASAIGDSSLGTIYTYAASSAAISLPKKRLKSATRHLLPDDKHFHSRDLLRLFLKPRALAHCGQLSNNGKQNTNGTSHINPRSALWSSEARTADLSQTGGDEAKGNYDADFFQDDGLNLQQATLSDDDDEYANALETFGDVPGMPESMPVLDGSLPLADGHSNAFGSQLLIHGRKVKPEYVQYAKSAKKIDVRQLKEEIWKGIDNPRVS